MHSQCRKALWKKKKKKRVPQIANGKMLHLVHAFYSAAVGIFPLSLAYPGWSVFIRILTMETKEKVIEVLTLMRPLFLQCSFVWLDWMGTVYKYTCKGKKYVHIGKTGTQWWIYCFFLRTFLFMISLPFFKVYDHILLNTSEQQILLSNTDISQVYQHWRILEIVMPLYKISKTFIWLEVSAIKCHTCCIFMIRINNQNLRYPYQFILQYIKAAN